MLSSTVSFDRERTTSPSRTRHRRYTHPSLRGGIGKNHRPPKIMPKTKAAKESAGGSSSSSSKSCRDGGDVKREAVPERSAGGNVLGKNLFGLPRGKKCPIDVSYQVVGGCAKDQKRNRCGIPYRTARLTACAQRRPLHEKRMREQG